MDRSLFPMREETPPTGRPRMYISLLLSKKRSWDKQQRQSKYISWTLCLDFVFFFTHCTERQCRAGCIRIYQCSISHLQGSLWGESRAAHWLCCQWKNENRDGPFQVRQGFFWSSSSPSCIFPLGLLFRRECSATGREKLILFSSEQKNQRTRTSGSGRLPIGQENSWTKGLSRNVINKQTLSSLFENGGDPNGRCAFLNMTSFKIQRGDCNKDGTFFFCTTGKTNWAILLNSW